MDINNYFQKKYRQFPVVRQEDMPLYKPLQAESEMLANATEPIDYCSLYSLGFRDSFIVALAKENMLKVRKTTQREQENNDGASHFTYLVADDGISQNALYINKSGSVSRELLAGSDPQALFVYKCDENDIKNALIFNNILDLFSYLQIAALIGNWPWQTIAIASVDFIYAQRGLDSSETPYQTERLIALLYSLSIINPLRILLSINKNTEPYLQETIQRYIPTASISNLVLSSLANSIDGLNSSDKLVLRNAQSYQEIMIYLLQKIDRQKKENKKNEQAEFKTLFGRSENASN